MQRVRVYVSFDDTDCLGADRGSRELVRWFAERLPEGCTPWGVVRQQLVHSDVPFTSHNSPGCAILDVPDGSYLPLLAEPGAEHITEQFIEGSDPGLCIADENADLSAVIAFARRAAIEAVTQDEACAIAKRVCVHLSGHGGTEDGVIGALAGVGLTAWGWSGRLVEFNAPLRDFPVVTTVGELDGSVHGSGVVAPWRP